MNLLDLFDIMAVRVTAWSVGVGAALYLLRQLWRALRGTVRGIRGLLRAVRTVHRLGEALLGDTDKGIPGMPERMDRLDAEFHPNGGGSLRDVVNDTRTKVDAVAAGQEAANGRLTSMELRLTALETAKPMIVNVPTPASPTG